MIRGTKNQTPATIEWCLRVGALFLLLVLPFALQTAGAASEGVEIRVPVESESDEHRLAASREALGQALVRFTGRDAIADDAKVAGLLESPDDFVLRYGYETSEGGLFLLAEIDGSALRKALAERQVPVWPRKRSPVLVWLALDRGGERLLASADEAPDISAALEAAAERRGVTLMFPLLDAEDREQVKFADVYGGFHEPVDAASERYGASFVLSGRLQREGGRWVGRWALRHGRSDAAWDGSAAELDAVIDLAMSELAERLAEDQGIVPLAGSGAELVLRVAGVDDLRAYLATQRYLRGLAGVRNVIPVVMENNAIAVRLDLEVEPTRVIRQLDRGRTLARQPAAPPVATAEVGAEHSYRLIQ